MQKQNLLAAAMLAAALVSGCMSGSADESGRPGASFEKDWRFAKGDQAGAEKTDFADASWQVVSLPHDWSIEGPFAQTNPTGRGGGYLPSGISWYRKTFTLPAGDAGRRVYVDFDGIMANSDVWINGYHLGKRPYGFVSFRYDLTGHLNFGPGQANILCVRTDTTQQPASHFYAGNGIYRHARLVVSEPVHLKHWGVFVTTPKVTPEAATIHIQTTVVNDSGQPQTVSVTAALKDPSGEPVSMAPAPAASKTLAAGETAVFEQETVVQKPRVWDLDHPQLYQVNVRVAANGKSADQTTEVFGVRTFEFKADTGFWLNGRNLKIYGACLHEDGGAFGMAVPARIWERRLEMLRSLGINAIRTVHNPPAPEFMALCDRMGFLVMLEAFDTWRGKVGGADYGYNAYFDQWWEKDLTDIVLRDRNHPSLILYSLGNEIRDNLNEAKGRDTFVALRDLVHRLDPTRPVTFALFRPNDPSQKVYTNGFAELMDVVGQDYRDSELLDAWTQKPTRKVLGTANSHDRSVLMVLKENKFLAGQFIFSAVDYLGEADWPYVFSPTGLLDHTGGMKVRAMERQSWWADQPVLSLARYDEDNGRGEIVPNWTPASPADYQHARLAVYSNCQEVELFVNGESLGKKPVSSTFGPRVWNVAYKPGLVKAVGRNNGQIVATQEMRTAGEPAKIALAVDRSKITNSWEDVACVVATIVDKDGVMCPNSESPITFKTEGPGAVAAVDNADNAAHESFRAPTRNAWKGQCVAFLKASQPGKIVVIASSPGLESGTLTIDVAAATSP